MALAITRREHSAAELRREARGTRDSDQARRLLAEDKRGRYPF